MLVLVPVSPIIDRLVFAVDWSTYVFVVAALHRRVHPPHPETFVSTPSMYDPAIDMPLVLSPPDPERCVSPPGMGSPAWAMVAAVAKRAAARIVARVFMIVSPFMRRCRRVRDIG